MNKAEELRERYERDLEWLQKNCPHAELTDWMEEYWAVAHSSGFQVRLCKECDKQMERKPLIPTTYATYIISKEK